MHTIRTDGLSDTEIESLGGNTMDLRCVAAALLVASALVDWTSQQRTHLTRPRAATSSERKRRRAS